MAFRFKSLTHHHVLIGWPKLGKKTNTSALLVQHRFLHTCALLQIGRAYPMQPSAATHNYLATLPRGISGITGGDPIAYGGYGGLPEGYPSLGGYTHGGIGYMTGMI